MRTQPGGNRETLYLIRSYDHEERNDPLPSNPSTRKSTPFTSTSKTGRTNTGNFAEARVRPRRETKLSDTINYEKAQRFEVWEVARAATAARFFFEPLKIKLPGSSEHVVFEDGGFGHANNPTLEGTHELEDLYGHNSVGIVVSVGTARKDEERKKPVSFAAVRRATKNFAAIATHPEAVHRSMDRRSKGIHEELSLSYFRLNDPGRLGVELDEWEPKKTIFNKISGSTTLSTIEGAFNNWASEKKNTARLAECAAALVRCRRARVKDMGKWERFATGARFTCQSRKCDSEDFLDRSLFRQHLREKHPETLNVHGEEENASRVVWRYRKPESGTRSHVSDTFPELPVANQQEKSLPADLTSVSSDHVPNDHDDSGYESYMTAADNFAQNPDLYFDALHDLQTRVFRLGKDFLGKFAEEKEGQCLTLPEVPYTFDDAAQKSGSLRQLLGRNLSILSAILEGLHILESANFCKSTYNIIVRDALRNDVVRVVPIARPKLLILYELTEEALSHCVPTPGDVFHEILSDIRLSLKLILNHLGLSMASLDSVESDEFEGDLSICKALTSTASILFVGLVSFVRSHLFSVSEDSGLPTSLRIETADDFVLLEPKRLACLDACLQHSIWAFGISVPRSTPAALDDEIPDRFSVSVYLADLADLWGPIDLRYKENDKLSVSEIRMRGGVIRRTDTSSLNSFYQNETSCHWYSWMQGSPGLWPTESLPTTGRLLIGAAADRSRSRETFVPGCTTCSGQSCVLAAREFELKTKIASWNIDARTGQITAGKYANLTCGQTWKFDAGWTLKETIVEDWMENIEKSERHQPKPFYLDYMIVIETSRCSGHSRRLSLWQLITSNVLDSYVDGILDPQARAEFKILKGHGCSSSFATIWRQKLSSREKSLTKHIIYMLLENLRCTGVGEDGSLQSWDVTSCDRIDGRRIKTNWTPMVKDDTGSATFAIITNECFRYAGTPRGSSQYDVDPVLSTQLCITVSQPVRRKHHGTRDFTQWRAQQPPRDLNTLDDVRLEIVEEARLSSGPDLVAIRGRQLKRRHKRTFAVDSDTHRKVDGGVIAAQGRYNAPPSSNQSHSEFASQPEMPVDMMCGRFLRFRNGKGDQVGKLTLRFHGNMTLINLSRISTKQPLPVGWETRKESIIAAFPRKIKGKARELDEAAIEWFKRKVTNPLPWMIEPDAESETVEEYAVEHLRGGNLAENQKVLSVHVY